MGNNIIEDEKLNILFILADDLGQEGVSAYGGELVETPNIDRLAKEGMRFTNMFVNPYCTPTRSELLTGRYPFRTNTLLPTICKIAGAPLPEKPIDGQSFAKSLAGDWLMDSKDWVHVQKQEGNYLRTKEWIVTSKGAYKKVQPYPGDAIGVDKNSLPQSLMEKLNKLERQLKDLNASSLK